MQSTLQLNNVAASPNNDQDWVLGVAEICALHPLIVGAGTSIDNWRTPEILKKICI